MAKLHIGTNSDGGGGAKTNGGRPNVSKICRED